MSSTGWKKDLTCLEIALFGLAWLGHVQNQQFHAVLPWEWNGGYEWTVSDSFCAPGHGLTADGTKNPSFGTAGSVVLVFCSCFNCCLDVEVHQNS